jgi:Tfp pilus assembly protein PilX
MEGKDQPMKLHASAIANQRGSVLILAMLILAVATIIGVAAINSSTTERQTSTNFMLYERAFYAAEAGLEHMKEVMRNGLRDPAVLATLATNGRANWTFVLDGDVVTGKPAATAANYEGGIKWIVNQPFDSFTYTVTVWDNDDEAIGTKYPAADADGIIWIRSVASGPQNSSCSIETSLDANTLTSPINGYTAQDGSGSGKAYTSSDKNAVDLTNITTQVHTDG